MLNSTQLHQMHMTVLKPTATILGEILWFLLKASNAIAELTDSKAPKDENGFVRLSDIEPTEFRQELSGDEIHWWVFKKESNLEELKKRTEVARDAVQRLKEAAVKLQQRHSVRSYDELLSLLKLYAESHASDINTLYLYVKWLYQQDPLAPGILFTYRVWGTTRRTERWWLGKLASSLEEENPEVIRRLTEIMLGLYRTRPYGLYTWQSVYQEYQMELSESYSEEETTYIRPSARDVLVRTAYESFGEFTVPFEFIRNSLNNILVDIEKHRSQTALMRSDSFWRRVIAKALKPGKSEEQLWELKTTLNMWHIKAAKEKDKAEVEFAEDVASLANARGGILIVGVSNTPAKIEGIGNQLEIEHRLKYTRLVLGERVKYANDIFHFHQVSIDDGNGNLRYCLVIVIAQARNVVEVKGEDGRYSYPIRLETGVERVARDEIAEKKM